jgi:hypothetical protein
MVLSDHTGVCVRIVRVTVMVSERDGNDAI